MYGRRKPGIEATAIIQNDYCLSNVILFVQFLHKNIYIDEKLINTLKLDKTSVLY